MSVWRHALKCGCLAVAFVALALAGFVGLWLGVMLLWGRL